MFVLLISFVETERRGKNFKFSNNKTFGFIPRTKWRTGLDYFFWLCRPYWSFTVTVCIHCMKKRSMNILQNILSFLLLLYIRNKTKIIRIFESHVDDCTMTDCFWVI